MHRSKVVDTIILRSYDDVVLLHHYNVLVSFSCVVMQDFKLKRMNFCLTKAFSKTLSNIHHFVLSSTLLEHRS